MKGAIKFQATNTDHNHNPLQLSNRMGTEQGVGKGIKMMDVFLRF